MLTLNYMVRNSPWKDEDMSGIYFPESLLDHYPSIFDYSVALTVPQMHKFALKKGIIEKSTASADVLRGPSLNIQKYLI